VIIDGRILKRNLDNHVGDAPLMIGYGPGLVAGDDVDFVVETDRGHNLGRIITSGTAAPDTGVPGDIAGITRARVLRAPADGVLHARRCIGDLVQPGDVIATVADQPVTTTIAGSSAAWCTPNRRWCAARKSATWTRAAIQAACDMLSDKARTISGAALEIILTYLNRRSAT